MSARTLTTHVTPCRQRSVPTVPGAPRIAAIGTAFSLLWSSAFIAGKIGLASAGPLTFLSLRFLIAGGVMAMLLPLLRRAAGANAAAPARHGLLRALAAGLLINAVYLGLAYLGLRTVPAALTAILVSISPLLSAGLAALLLGERLGWRAAFGLAAGFGGVVLIMGRRLGVAAIDPLGAACILAGTLALSIGTLLSRRVASTFDPWPTATLQLLASGALLLPLAWQFEGLAVRVDAAFIASLLYQSLVVSIGTTLMLLWLVRHGGVGRAGAFHLLNPFFSSALAVVLLGETLLASDLLGLLPIVAGLALILVPAARPETGRK